MARRWLLRTVAVLLALLFATVAGALLLLTHLDAPWLKRRVVAAIRARAGFDVDWATLRVHPLSGLELRDLNVLSPSSFRAVAPELARVGALDVAWSPGSLLGAGPPISLARVSQASLTVVQDANGTRSLAPAAAPEAASAPAAISGLIPKLMSRVPPLSALELDGLDLTVLTTRGDHVEDRLALRLSALRLSTAREGSGWQWRVTSGTPGESARVDIEQSRNGRKALARLDLRVDLSANSRQAHALLGVQVEEQNFAPKLELHQLARIEASALFAPREGRIEVELSRADLLDAAGSAHAKVQLYDDARKPPYVEQAAGDFELARLAAVAGPLDLPVSNISGHFHFQVAGLRVAAIPELERGGSVLVEGSLPTLSARVREGVANLRDTHLSAALRPGPQSGIDAEVTLSPAQAEWVGPLTAQGRDARLHLRVSKLEPDPASPFGFRGSLALAADLNSGTLQTPRGEVRVDQLHAGVSLPSPSLNPLVADVEIRSHVRSPWADEQLAAEMRVRDVRFDSADPRRTSGQLNLTVASTSVQASANVSKLPDSARFDVSAHAQPPHAAWTLGWERTALTLSARGRVEELATDRPRAWLSSTLRVDAPSLHLGKQNISAKSVTVTANGSGAFRQATAKLNVQLDSVAIDDAPAGDEHIDAEVELVGPAKRVRLALKADGTLGPTAQLDLKASLDGAAHELTGELEARVSHLGGVAPLLAPPASAGRVELAPLELHAVAHGKLAGLFAGIDAAGMPVPSPHPERTVQGDADAQVELGNLRWEQEDRELELKTATLSTSLRAHGERRGLTGSLAIDDALLASGPTEVHLHGGALHATAELDPRGGASEVDAQLTVQHVEQNAAAGYPLGELALAVSARREKDGVISLSRATLDNPAAGTHLELHGGAALAELPPKISVDVQLRQDLGKLWTQPEVFQGRGVAGVHVVVESSSFHLFRTTAEITLVGAELHLPQAGIQVDGIYGEVPVAVTVAMDPSGPRLVGTQHLNPYSILRFSDQHPLLSRHSYLSISKLSLPGLTVEPFAANLKVEQNVVSLGQLEMGLRGGRVTGQCTLEWAGWDSRLHADIRASGVLSSYGEPFDGNAAVVISARDRSIDGHAEVLRIGRRHLLDLLDTQDPHRVQPAFNRVRRALALGYPERLTLFFDHGFAGAHIAFGGLARFIRVDDIRGIPLEPLLDKVLKSNASSEEP